MFHSVEFKITLILLSVWDQKSKSYKYYIYIISCTRRSNFWTSSEFGGGSHLTHTHAFTILVQPNLSSKLIITCFKRFKISLSVQYEQMEVDQMRDSNKLKSLDHLIWGDIRADQKRDKMHMRHMANSSKFWSGPKIEPLPTHRPWYFDRRNQQFHNLALKDLWKSRSKSLGKVLPFMSK